MRTNHHPEADTEINVTPMLDIVFILLIFFIVTTSFIKERGLAISSPANPPEEQIIEEPPILVRIDGESRFWFDQRMVDRWAMHANLVRENAVRPQAGLIIAADADATTDALVAVLDTAGIVGIESVSVATQQ